LVSQVNGNTATRRKLDRQLIKRGIDVGRMITHPDHRLGEQPGLAACAVATSTS
jgi:hypothetical protein